MIEISMNFECLFSKKCMNLTYNKQSKEKYLIYASQLYFDFKAKLKYRFFHLISKGVEEFSLLFPFLNNNINIYLTKQSILYFMIAIFIISFMIRNFSLLIFITSGHLTLFLDIPLKSSFIEFYMCST